MAFSVKTEDIAGCKIAYLAPPTPNSLNGKPIGAMQELVNRGVPTVISITHGEALDQYVKTQKRHKSIPSDQRYFRLTEKGNIVRMFI